MKKITADGQKREDSSRRAWREHVEYERYLQDLREEEEELSDQLSNVRWQLWNS